MPLVPVVGSHCHKPMCSPTTLPGWPRPGVCSTFCLEHSACAQGQRSSENGAGNLEKLLRVLVAEHREVGAQASCYYPVRSQVPGNLSGPDGATQNPILKPREPPLDSRPVVCLGGCHRPLDRVGAEPAESVQKAESWDRHSCPATALALGPPGVQAQEGSCSP